MRIYARKNSQSPMPTSNFTTAEYTLRDTTWEFCLYFAPGVAGFLCVFLFSTFVFAIVVVYARPFLCCHVLPFLVFFLVLLTHAGSDFFGDKFLEFFLSSSDQDTCASFFVGSVCSLRTRCNVTS